MTPFVLLQLVGPAVALHVAETLHEAFPDRFARRRRARGAGRGAASRRSYLAEHGDVDPEVAASVAGGRRR